MANLLDPVEAAARVRAAATYASKEYKDIAAATGIGESTILRIASPSKPRGAKLEELWLIADACGVPRAFMEEGFAPLSPNGLRDEVAQLREQVAVLQADLATLDLEVLQRIVATATPKAPPQQGPPQ